MQLKKLKKAENLSSISTNLRTIVFSFLDYKTLKLLLFLNKLLHSEILYYLSKYLDKLVYTDLNNFSLQEQINFVQFHQGLTELKITLFEYLEDDFNPIFPPMLKQLTIECMQSQFINQCKIILYKISLLKQLDKLTIRIYSNSLFTLHTQQLIEKKLLPNDVQQIYLIFSELPKLRSLKVQYAQTLNSFHWKLPPSNLFYSLTHTKHNLQTINLQNQYFTQSQQAEIVKNETVTSLTILNNSNDNSLGLNEESFIYITSAFPNLTKISIVDSSEHHQKVREFSYSMLAILIERLPKLKELELNSYICQISIAQFELLQFINSLPQLTCFGFASCKQFFSSMLTELIQSNAQLQELNLDYAQIDDQGLQILQMIAPNLTRLSLQYCTRLSRTGLLDFFNLISPKFISLNIRGLKGFTGKTLKLVVRNSPNLQYFYSHANSLSDNSVAMMLIHLKELKELEISKNDDFQKFTKLVFQTFNKQYFNYEKAIYPKKITPIKLKKLDLSFNFSFDNDTMFDLTKNITQLKQLNIKECHRITIDAFKYLSTITFSYHLRKLNLKNNIFGNKLFKLIKQLFKFPNLQFVYLSLELVEDQYNELIKFIKRKDYFSNQIKNKRLIIYQQTHFYPLLIFNQYFPQKIEQI